MAILEVILKTSGLGNVKDLNKGFDDMAQSLLGINTASLTTAGLIAAVGTELKRSIDAAAEAEQVHVRLANALKNTDGALTMTVDQAELLANSLARLSGVDDELIGGAMSVMMRFQNISDETFPRAIQAALDLSAAMGTDLNSAVMMIGKAMENPEQGMTQLQRAGVRLSDSQKELVKDLMETGNIAGAQEVVMKALEDRYKGAAQEAGDTYAGALQKLKIEFGNLEENIGGILIPILAKAAEAFNLLFFGNKMVADVLKTHSDEVLKSANGYASYYTEMHRAAEAAGYFVNENGDLVSRITQSTNEWGVDYPETIETIVQANYLLSQSEYELAVSHAKSAAEVKGKTLSEEEAAKAAEEYLKKQKEIEEEIRRVTEATTDAALAVTEMGVSFNKTTQKQREGMLLESIRDAMRAGGASDTELVNLMDQGNLKFGYATKESQNLAKIQAEVKKELEGGAKYSGDMLNFIEKLSAASTVLAQNELWNKFKATEINSQIDMLGSPLGASNTFGSPLQTEKNQAVGTTQPADIGLASTNTQLTETNKYVTSISDASGQIEKNFRSLADGLKPLLDKITKELTDANVAMQKNFFKPVNDALTLADETAKAILKDLIALKKWADENIITIRIRYSYEGASPGKRALGGDVAANKPYIVGENGPELFVPPSSGTIIPNNKISSYVDNGNSVGGGSNKSITNNIYFEFKDTTLDEETLKEAWGRVVALA